MDEEFRNVAQNKKRVSPFISDNKRFEVTIPLRNSFRFVHEPIGGENNSLFVGRTTEIDALVERILFSNGGSFLVTGYRGVGKTSFINQVVHKLENALSWAETFLGKTEIIDIYMNVARPLQPSEIMHHIIRRMYERLLEKNIYPLLSPESREAIETAYNRTSLNMARKLSESKEQTIGSNEINLGGFLLKAGVKIPWSRKYSSTQNFETSYLGYDDKAAEHDIISISKKLSRGYNHPLSFWQYLKYFFYNNKTETVSLKIIFVFDELDKLEEYTVQIGEETRPAIEDILSALKNLFTTSGVTFIFVAGKDLQERWLEDVGKGDSVYESVFSYDKYLPCLWTESDAICENLIENFAALSVYESNIIGEFQKYLTYRGRGIPRRIVRTFNEYVKWNEEKPVAAFTPQNIRTIRFFAAIQDLISANEKQLFGSSHEDAAGTMSDKRRLGIYYIFDWIFRQENTQFSAEDVFKASKKLSRKIALAEEVALQMIEKILSILAAADYIEKIHRTIKFVVGGANPNTSPVASDKDLYRISPRRLGEIAGIVADVQIPELNMSDATFPLSASDARDEQLPPAIGKYKIIRKIGSGGMGTVYEASDFFGRVVAIKLSHNDLSAPSAELRDRFKREAAIMKNLDHPNIVKFYEFGEFGERVYIAMEYLSGVTLEKILNAKNRLNFNLALTVARAIAEAVAYVHSQGYGRNDIKPSNIILTDDGRIRVFDFGISKPLSSAHGQLPEDFRTFKTAIVGTPLFMAPELFDDSSRVDERSDVYSLGVVMYKMLTGSFPFDQANFFDLMKAKMENRIIAPSVLISSIPVVFDDIVMKCLNFAPEERFQTMNDVSEALNQITSTVAVVENLTLLVAEVRSDIGRAVKAEQRHTLINAPANYSDISANHEILNSFEAMPSDEQSILPISPPTLTDTQSRLNLSSPASAIKETNGEIIDDEIDSDKELFKFLGASAFLQEAKENPDGSSRIYKLEKKMTIGRSYTNDIVLDSPEVSRYQAVIDWDAEKSEWFIEELNSANGTFVNNELIFRRCYLADQDKIKIGAAEFVFKKRKAN